MTTDPRRPRDEGPSGGGRDLLVALTVVAGVFALGAALDAFDRMEAWIVANEHADEILGLSVMLIVATGVVATRRARQAKAERHRREEAEASYRALVEESPAISYTWDPVARTHLYVSPKVEPLLGYTSEAWAVDFETWSRYVHPDDREAVLAASIQADADATDFVSEYRVIAADGRIVWIRDESRHVAFDSSGRPTLAQGVMFDITARHDAEQRLRDAEERWRTLLDHLPVTAYRIDYELDGGRVHDRWVAPSVTGLLGLTPEEWLADEDVWERRLAPEDRDGVLAAWASVARAGGTLDQEYRMLHRDGRVVWVREESAVTVRDGRLLAEGVFIDVTARRAAEDALRDAEGRYRNLVERLPAMTYVEDPESGRTLYISPQIHELMGYSPEEWIEDPDLWARCLHPDDRAWVVAANESDSGDTWAVDYRSITRDGRTIWVHNDTVLIRDDEGRPLYWQGVVTDITERKQAEERLRRAEERFRSLVEQLPVAVYTDAVDDVSTALYVSPRYEQLTGYTAEQRLADPSLWVRMLHDDDRERVLAESRRTNETGDAFDVEYRIVTVDGRTVWLHDHAVLVSEPGGGRIWQGVLQDVTERRVAQDALTRRDAILQATGFAAERLLGSSSWEEVIPEVLATLGRAGTATRAFLYRNDEEEDGTLVVSTIGRWSADGEGGAADQANAEPFPWVAGGFSRWTDILGGGQVLHGPVSTFPDSERRLLEQQGIGSLLAVPIFVRGAWWGYVGFEEAEEPRVWHDSEVEALTVTANTLAAAITRDLAASELAATQQRYQILVEQIPAMTYIQRASDASILYYSPQVHDVLGYEPQEWGGFEFWAEAIHPDDRDRVLEHDRRTNETGEPFSIEYRLHAKDGRIVWIRDDAVLVRDEEGIPSYWQGIRFDITEQKEAEERLRTAEERYRGIVEHVPAAIYLDSADASLRSSYVSPQILEIAGVRPEEWVADPDLWSRMIHPDDRQRVLAGYVAAATEGTDWSDEYRMRTADGRTIWVHDETTVLHDEQGTPAVIQGVIFDITERKLAEQALRDSELREREAAERLRALDEMKNTFLAAVSHELRSPLTSILGLSLTLERAPDMDDEDQGDLLRRLSRNAHKLDRLLKDLLDIDRLNRGIVEPQYRVTDVGALARRSVEHLDALAGREVAVHTEPVEMAVDPAKTERIVENLLINASRHTPPDRKIWLQVRPSEGGVLIAVDDEGPGVPEALRAEIFQPFRQGPTASPHSPGTGIGLSLVARFAELHGGRAWVEDREGGGASFRVYLPSRPVDEGVDGDDTARPAASAQV